MDKNIKKIVFKNNNLKINNLNDKTINKIVNKPIVPPVNNPNVPLVNKQNIPPINKPNIPPVNKPIVPLVNKPNVPPVNKPNVPHLNKPIVTLVNKPTIQILNKPNIQPINKPNIHPVNKPLTMPVNNMKNILLLNKNVISKSTTNIPVSESIIKVINNNNNKLNKDIELKKNPPIIEENDLSESKNENCIVIFAYNRFHYLTRVLNSVINLEGIENWHIIYIQDGPICIKTKTVAETFLPKIKCKSLKKYYFDNNKGIALSQHFGLIEAFVNNKYKYVLHLEDDLVLSPTYLKSIESLLDFTENNNSIAYVSGSHITNGKSDKLLTSPIGLIHSWGIGISRSKFLIIEPTYTKSIEILY